METMANKKPRQRRSFTPEFKAEVVALVRQTGRSVSSVAREMDLTETAVREWVRQAERDKGKRADGLTTAERAEMAQLQGAHLGLEPLDLASGARTSCAPGTGRGRPLPRSSPESRLGRTSARRPFPTVGGDGLSVPVGG